MNKNVISTVDSIQASSGIDLRDQATRRRVLYFWGLCYLDEVTCQSGDPHQAFADLLEVPRQIAKVICYAIHHVSDCHASNIMRLMTNPTCHD